MTEISLILFDLNGVLYRYDRDVRIRHLAVVSGRSADSIEAAIWASGFEDSGDAGTLDADAYLRGFGACLGCDLSEADWLAAQQAAVTPIAGTLSLLSQIRPGVLCAVLTNNNVLVQRHFATLYPDIVPHIGERAFVSAMFAAGKPDPEVYRRCLARLGVAPTATLFVDDSLANVRGAEVAELLACHYECAEDLRRHLGKFGLLRR